MFYNLIRKKADRLPVCFLYEMIIRKNGMPKSKNYTG